MKHIILFYCIFACVFVNGCSRKCEPFPDEMKTFTPCELNDKMVFRNQEGDSMVFECSSVKMEGDESIPFGCKCECGTALRKTYQGVYNVSEWISVTEDKWTDYFATFEVKPSESSFNDNVNNTKSSFGASWRLQEWLSKDSILLCSDGARLDSLTLIKGEGIHSFLDSEKGLYYRVL